MGNKKPKTKKVKYVLGGIEFSKWEEVVKHSREILKKGRRVLESEEFSFVRDLLEYHPYAEEKLKGGVRELSVKEPEFGAGAWFCFWITDNDGFEQDFSHKRCRPNCKKDINKARARVEKDDRLSAYRDAIANQAKEWRKLQKKQLCACCDSSLDVQVDHVNPFVEIVSGFERQHNFDDYPKLERHNDGLYTFRFVPTRQEDVLFIEAWRRYHKSHAEYQLLCRSCNLSKSSNGKRYVVCGQEESKNV